MLKKVTSSLAPKWSLFILGTVCNNAVFWSGGMLTAPLRLVCPLPTSWLEKLASEVHVDPVAAVVQDAGQQLSSGLGAEPWAGC